MFENLSKEECAVLQGYAAALRELRQADARKQEAPTPGSQSAYARAFGKARAYMDLLMDTFGWSVDAILDLAI